MITAHEFFESPPKLHVHPATNEPVFWGFSEQALRELASLVPPRGVTMETGAGMSTVYFTMCGFVHTAIAPDQRLFDRIRTYCQENGIDTSNLTLIDAPSEDYLAHTELPELDFFLIDGRHAFPTPFLDYYFGAKALKVGGYIVVDDTHILTGTILAEFLKDDVHWDEARQLETTVVFRKRDALVHADGWGQQIFLTSGREITPPKRGTPTTPEDVISRGWLHCSRHEFEAALELTAVPEEGYETDQLEYERQVLRGHALRGLDRLDDADSCLTRALEIFPNAPGAWAEKAWLQLRKGAPASAIEAARRIEEVAEPGSETHSWGLEVLGVALGQAGRLDEALEKLTLAAERIGNDQPWPRLHRAQCLAEMSRLEEAREDLEFALRLAPDNEEALALQHRLTGHPRG